MPRNATEMVRVTAETWSRLNALKEPGDSFNDVITRLIEEDDEGNQQPMTATATN